MKKDDDFSYHSYKIQNIPEKALLAAIIRQAFDDSNKRVSDIHQENVTLRLREIHLSRMFLTGNYSRHLLQIYCLYLGISPNYIIKIAMQQKWSKKYKPCYFEE